jgi:hypothetical protein
MAQAHEMTYRMDAETFLEMLLSETSAAMQRSAGDSEALRGVVFLFLNRAYEAGLEPDLICNLLGASEDNVLNRAGLSKKDEAAVMDAYEILDPLLEQRYKRGEPESRT